jgi:nucleotide-binding universal stress UspA family protein
MFKKVLVPLDGSELSECSLSYVTNLVKEGSAADVILLTVVAFDIPIAEIPSYDMIVDRGAYFRAFRDDSLVKSREYLEQVESRLKSEGLRVETVLLEGGRSADRIIDFSRQNGVDLIVMATHGYSGLKKMLLGSVAFTVLHESPVPVLLIRPESCRKQ